MSEPRTVIHADHLLDVVAGRWLDDARILVEGDRVLAVLAAGDPTPADALDLRPVGAWIVPGLIDCHSHQVGEMEFAGVPGHDDVGVGGGAHRGP